VGRDQHDHRDPFFNHIEFSERHTDPKKS